MKRLAILFFGFHYKKYLNHNVKKYILVDYRKSISNYQSFIFDYFKSLDYEIDIFYSTYSSEIQNELEKDYKPVSFKIFEKVYPDSDGTGVGLAIVKRVVESHKGKVWVESEGQGLGTTFCIMFAK